MLHSHGVLVCAVHGLREQLHAAQTQNTALQQQAATQEAESQDQQQQWQSHLADAQVLDRVAAPSWLGCNFILHSDPAELGPDAALLAAHLHLPSCAVRQQQPLMTALPPTIEVHTIHVQPCTCSCPVNKDHAASTLLQAHLLCATEYECSCCCWASCQEWRSKGVEDCCCKPSSAAAPGPSRAGWLTGKLHSHESLKGRGYQGSGGAGRQFVMDTLVSLLCAIP